MNDINMTLHTSLISVSNAPSGGLDAGMDITTVITIFVSRFVSGDRITRIF